MIKAEFTEHFIFLKGAENKDRAMLESYLNAVNTKRGWRLPINVHVMRELYKVLPGIANNEFMDIGKRLARPILTPVPETINTKLRLYQRDDAAFLAGHRVACVFNDPRTGKTPTVLEALRLAKAKRVLIVVPASLQYNWFEEIGNWRPDVHLIKIITRAPYPEGDGYFIVSKNKVSKIPQPVRPFDTVVVDEAHYLRNFKTVQSKAVCKIKAGRRYALTGTPAVNHPSDVIGILMFLKPEAYPSFWQTAERYFDIYDGPYSKEIGKLKGHRMEEFKDVVGRMAVQRKRKDVMQWLPPKQYSRIAVELGKKQRDLYTSMKDDFLAQLDDVEIDASTILSQMMRLRQLALDPRLVGFDMIGSKTEALYEFLESHKEPVVIMSAFTSYLKLLAKGLKGKRVAFIHGEMTNKQKQDTAQDFQAGKVDILFCNIKSACTGFTLDHGHTIIFLDREWTPAENQQAEDRICPTQENRLHKHEIIDFVAVKTVEEKILLILQKKQSINAIVDNIKELLR